MGVHLVCALGWLTMLATLTLLSWAILWSRDQNVRQALTALRRRLLPPLWTAIGLLVATGIFNQYRNVPFPLPQPWNFQDISVPYGKAYLFLLLGKHVFIAQMTVALVALSWRLVASAPLAGIVGGVTALGALPMAAGGLRTMSAQAAPLRVPLSGVAETEAPPVAFAEAQASELGTALIGTLSLVSGILVLLTTAGLGYVHVLAHGHGH